MISGRLAREGRSAGTNATAIVPMADCAGGNAPRAIAMEPDGWSAGGLTRVGRRGKGGVVGRHRAAIFLRKPADDGLHAGVLAQARGVVIQLFLQVAAIQAGQPRNALCVALAGKPVTGEAGACWPSAPAAHRDDLAVCVEGALSRFGKAAAGREQAAERQQGEGEAHVSHNTAQAKWVPSGT